MVLFCCPYVWFYLCISVCWIKIWRGMIWLQLKILPQKTKFRLLKAEVLQAACKKQWLRAHTTYSPPGRGQREGVVIVFALCVIKRSWKSKLLTSSTKIRRQHIFKIQTLSVSSKWWIWLAINWDNLGKPCSIQGNSLTGRWGELRSLSIPVHGPFWQWFDPTFDPLANLYFRPYYHSLSVLVRHVLSQSRRFPTQCPGYKYSLPSTPSDSWNLFKAGFPSVIMGKLLGISNIYWPPIDLHSNLVYFSCNPGTLTVPSST